MGEMNGMELAQKIRETDTGCEIIFLTSSPNFVYEGYEVGAFRYLQKRKDEDALKSLIKKVYEDKFRPHYLIIKSGAHIQSVAIKDISLLETTGKKVEITAAGGPFYYTGLLAELLEELPKGGFIRCHQAYAVNMAYVSEADRSEITMKNGKTISISRPYVNDVTAAYLNYLMEQ
jgi:DNA-binding LytR/AlgR family response regulator